MIAAEVEFIQIPLIEFVESDDLYLECFLAPINPRGRQPIRDDLPRGVDHVTPTGTPPHRRPSRPRNTRCTARSPPIETVHASALDNTLYTLKPTQSRSLKGSHTTAQGVNAWVVW